jgi:hypothetical protein
MPLNNIILALIKFCDEKGDVFNRGEFQSYYSEYKKIGIQQKIFLIF